MQSPIYTVQYTDQITNLNSVHSKIILRNIVQFRVPAANTCLNNGFSGTHFRTTGMKNIILKVYPLVLTSRYWIRHGKRGKQKNRISSDIDEIYLVSGYTTHALYWYWHLILYSPIPLKRYAAVRFVYDDVGI